MAQYYDYVLGVIPLVLVGLTTLLTLAGFELTTAIPVGAGVAALIIGHALFVNMPTQPTAESAEASQRVNAE
ncbi:hypothetical protein DM826_10325 [Halonotius aquaticus]|uniref:Uncharacterized protein n=1 Tax=Halonotius aquaticus TaxID=2216978 RepID=A0A3A6PJ82_9EURY|nr:hypothetical protein [Halonotius aquaticus]RJX42044.1 hypothetical protein DM826_10325 [Halonotius aquaticus]